MKIYLGHSSAYDYQTALYQPIKCCATLWKNHEFILPHDKQDGGFYSKSIIQSVDLFIAEVSLASTGLGMELAWADSNHIPILALTKHHTRPSSSINFIVDTIFKYHTGSDFIHIIKNFINAHK